nr:MAG TPA: hypothetical protein [Caudoviricetes sp.]
MPTMLSIKLFLMQLYDRLITITLRQGLLRQWRVARLNKYPLPFPAPGTALLKVRLLRRDLV